jgi:hypothetical protein
MEYLTDDILESAIRLQRRRIFDTHDVCFTLMTDFADDYIRELYQCLESSQEPFVKLHTDIAKRMASRDFRHVVRKHGGKHESMNCRGKKDECQVWEIIAGDKTVEPGYLNENGQKNLGRIEPPQGGTDNVQYVYVMNCTRCGCIYGSNGSDIFQRKCPACQNGAKGPKLKTI